MYVTIPPGVTEPRMLVISYTYQFLKRHLPICNMIEMILISLSNEGSHF